jgi:hypothetical protein
MKKAGALASALRNSGATVASPAPVHEPSPPPAATTPAIERAGAAQPSRAGTKAITVHFPVEVRRQLKTLAAEEGRNIEDMVAEALNLLFVKYRKAELAPRKASK